MTCKSSDLWNVTCVLDPPLDNKSRLHTVLWQNTVCVGGLIVIRHWLVIVFDCRCWDSTVVRALAFHQCGPRSIPILGVICGLHREVFLWVLQFFPLLKNQKLI